MHTQGDGQARGARVAFALGYHMQAFQVWKVSLSSASEFSWSGRSVRSPQFFTRSMGESRLEIRTY